MSGGDRNHCFVIGRHIHVVAAALDESLVEDRVEMTRGRAVVSHVSRATPSGSRGRLRRNVLAEPDSEARVLVQRFFRGMFRDAEADYGHGEAAPGRNTCASAIFELGGSSTHRASSYPLASKPHYAARRRVTFGRCFRCLWIVFTGLADRAVDPQLAVFLADRAVLDRQVDVLEPSQRLTSRHSR